MYPKPYLSTSGGQQLEGWHGVGYFVVWVVLSYGQHHVNPMQQKISVELNSVWNTPLLNIFPKTW